MLRLLCDLETSRIGAPYIYDISNLRVNVSLLLEYSTMPLSHWFPKFREFCDLNVKCQMSNNFLKIRPLRCLETSGIKHPVTRLHIQQAIIPQLYRCENQKSCVEILHLCFLEYKVMDKDRKPNSDEYFQRRLSDLPFTHKKVTFFLRLDQIQLA